MTAQAAGWRPCRTCGRWITVAEAAGPACSEECAVTYTGCTTCGRWFPRGTGFDDGHCTRECAVQYQLLRTYGPQPVTVVTEV